MPQGSERQCFTIQFYRFLQVLQMPCLLETTPQVNCEFVERVGAIRMARGTESEGFTISMNSFINIVRRLRLINGK